MPDPLLPLKGDDLTWVAGCGQPRVLRRHVARITSWNEVERRRCSGCDIRKRLDRGTCWRRHARALERSLVGDRAIWGDVHIELGSFVSGRADFDAVTTGLELDLTADVGRCPDVIAIDVELHIRLWLQLEPQGSHQGRFFLMRGGAARKVTRKITRILRQRKIAEVVRWNDIDDRGNARLPAELPVPVDGHRARFPTELPVPADRGRARFPTRFRIPAPDLSPRTGHLDAGPAVNRRDRDRGRWQPDRRQRRPEQWQRQPDRWQWQSHTQRDARGRRFSTHDRR